MDTPAPCSFRQRKLVRLLKGAGHNCDHKGATLRFPVGLEQRRGELVISFKLGMTPESP